MEQLVEGRHDVGGHLAFARADTAPAQPLQGDGQLVVLDRIGRVGSTSPGGPYMVGAGCSDLAQGTCTRYSDPVPMMMNARPPRRATHRL